MKTEEYDPYKFSDKELIEPFKTLDKGFDWLLDLAENIGQTLMIIPGFIVMYFGTVKIILKVYKDIVKDLTDSTSLTKKQAKKIVKKSIDAVGDAYDRCDESKVDFGYYETEVIMLYSIRSDKSLDKEVHQNCDIAVDSILRLINNEESEVWLTIAYKKELEALIEKYMGFFDNRRESKKYNGIWY
ncbi:hypothetical protein N9351_04770 [Candidatus Thioglobus sp.]|nr:hypothetical protein [Candidatus Thioglobus sp.]